MKLQVPKKKEVHSGRRPFSVNSLLADAPEYLKLSEPRPKCFVARL